MVYLQNICIDEGKLMKNKWLIIVFQNFLIKNIVCTGEQAK